MLSPPPCADSTTAPSSSFNHNHIRRSITGNHVLQCKFHNGRSLRHRAIVDGHLVPYLVEAGYDVTREDSSVYPVLLGDPGPRRMELVARDVRHGEPSNCVDVSIMGATTDRHIQTRGGSGETRLYAAGVAEKLNRKTYRETPDGHKLVPFIMEAHGALCHPAVELIRLLADRIAPRRAGARGSVASSVTENVAVQKALIKNEPSKAVERCQALPFHTGTNYVAGRLGYLQSLQVHMEATVVQCGAENIH
jgi:hypothetical protein